MKKILILLTFLALFSTPQPAYAEIRTAETPITITSDEVIDDDLFIAAESINIEGTVNGDLYAAGGTVNISGEITGDVLAAGGTVVVNGATIGQDLRLAGGNLTVINTSVADNATVFGGNITMTGETSINGTLVFAGGNALVEAPVGRNLYAGGGMVTFNSSVGNQARLGGGQLTLGPLTQIQGDLIYTTEKNINMDENAQIVGEIINRPSQIDTKQVERDFKAAQAEAQAGFTLWSLFAYLLLGTLFIALFPQTSDTLADLIQHQTWKVLGLGLLAMLLVLPLIMFALITIIGIPLAFIILFLFLLSLFLAKIFVAPALGNRVFALVLRRPKNRYISLITGLILLTVFAQVPVLAVFTMLFIAILGLGALILYSTNIIQSQRT